MSLHPHGVEVVTVVDGPISSPLPLQSRRGAERVEPEETVCRVVCTFGARDSTRSLTRVPSTCHQPSVRQATPRTEVVLDRHDPLTRSISVDFYPQDHLRRSVPMVPPTHSTPSVTVLPPLVGVGPDRPPPPRLWPSTRVPLQGHGDGTAFHETLYGFVLVYPDGISVPRSVC